MGIDRLNNENPLALFTITNSADYTDTERNQRRMKGKFANYTAMKEQLPESILSTKDEALKKFDADASDDDDADTSVVSGSEMEKSQVLWISAKDCAACNQYPTFSKYTMSNLPDNFGWRDLGAVTSVKNQKYCGSCWTFSTAADVEGTHFLATGNLTSFSEQQLIACDNLNDGCDGGWPYAAMQYLETSGLSTEASYPYAGIYMDYEQATPTCDMETVHNQMRTGKAAHIGGFQFVAMGDDYEALMAVAMVKNGPLSVAFNANGMEYYSHGIIGCETIADEEYCQAGSIDNHSPCDPESLDHAVLAMGIGVQEGVQLESNSTSDSTQYWVIKNSWGTDWGEDGYYRLERGVNKCGVANMVVHSVVKEA